MNDHFVIYRERRTPARLGRSRRWRWRLVAGNGEQVAQGQSYRDQTDAERAVEDVIDAIVVAEGEPVRFEP